jgi:glycerol-3-phosphate dehydrogenase (NAD(P)+)
MPENSILSNIIEPQTAEERPVSRTVAVIGAGSWGTAAAKLLAENGHDVAIWDRNLDRLVEMAEKHENSKYLPGVELPDFSYCPELEMALDGADAAVFGIPAQHFREVLKAAAPYIEPGTILVNLAKGIERGTLKTMSEVAAEIAPHVPYVALSGPSHAEEIARRLPASVTASSDDPEAAKEVQDIFMNDNFRVYTNPDLTGIELGGALKNIIALGAGISDGLGYGDSAKAAMITRGLTEISRLGISLGADPASFAGLSGMGDLIVTCCSQHSRNRRCGLLIGQGMKPEEAVEAVGMVVEGFYTADAAWELAKKQGVEMPITEAICRLIHGELSAEEAVKSLMTRSRKSESING